MAIDRTVKFTVRLNMLNPAHVTINKVLNELDLDIFKSKNQFFIDAATYYIENYGQEELTLPKKEKEPEFVSTEDMEVIEKYRKSVVSPNAKNSPEVVKIANTLLSRVREKLQQSAEKVLKKVQAVLLKPEVKQAGKEQIKNKARKSIKEKLAQGKLDADRENRVRWEREGRIAPTRKQDMEL